MDKNNDLLIETAANAFGDAIGKPLAAVTTAQTCLMSALVKHLAEKGVINIEEYLKSSIESENLLLKTIPDDEDAQFTKTVVSHAFNMHRNDFLKPE